MRGNDEQQGNVFRYINLDDRIPQEHPLRRIRHMTDTTLRQMSLQFEALYAGNGRPSIAPERLLRALLLQILFAIRGEARLMEQLNYNLLFRWFVGLNPTMRCGMPPCSARTAIACWGARSPSASWKRCCSRRRSSC